MALSTFKPLLPGGLTRFKLSLPKELVKNPGFENVRIKLNETEIQFYLKDPNCLYPEIWVYESTKEAWSKISFDLDWDLPDIH